ncbi:MAG: mitochondrial fission ELM1 family protein [Pseudobdellovibrionaceae bacterium]
MSKTALKEDSAPRVWIVSEDLRGTQNQAVGVAEALGVPYTVKVIGLKQPWKSLSPYLGMECSCAFTGDNLSAPWPDLVIAAGRKAIAAARYIKKSSNGKTFTVYLQDPRISPKNFDLVALPAHDPTRGENVLVTKATPNRITEKRLKDEAKSFSELAKLPSPRIALMIGGNSTAYDLTDDVARKLVNDIHAFRKTNPSSLMVTASRRTPDSARLIFEEGFQGENVFFWDEKSPNPYFAYLALADILMVTSDSASMLSEAATTGKPVYMIPLKRKSEKRTRLDGLHDSLIEAGAMRIFEGKIEHWDYTPLNDAQMVAAAIKKRLPDLA